jgi:hypothetical protein
MSTEKGADIVLFLEFGGHSMNGCTLRAVYNKGLTKFFMEGKAFAAGGGSEH